MEVCPSFSGVKRPFRKQSSSDIRVEISSLPNLFIVGSMITLLGMSWLGTPISSRLPHLALRSPHIRKSSIW